jgi:O-antigen/teichoic acid export membrane protein
MVFVAWFASFSFLPAMAFPEGYFQTNNNMRLIRVGFMTVLASPLVIGLLPTGSRNWLDFFHEDQGDAYYPSLNFL